MQNDNHPHTLVREDIAILILLNAGSLVKARKAITFLFGPDALDHVEAYRQTWTSFEEWHNHITDALLRAQEKVDAQSQ